MRLIFQLTGDCDTDDDCLDNLTCFLRESFEEVPGCFGSGVEGTDYCVETVGGDMGHSPDVIPTPAETIPATEENVLTAIAGSTTLPLGRCQGTYSDIFLWRQFPAIFFSDLSSFLYRVELKVIVILMMIVWMS